MTTTKTGIRLDEFSRRGWYEAYGAHIATARSGDVCVQRIDYDALDASDIAISTQLGDLTRDDRAKLIALARAVRSAADSVGDLLDDAVAAYASGDVPATIAALAEASRAESDHGDDPSTQAAGVRLHPSVIMEEVYDLLPSRRTADVMAALAYRERVYPRMEAS